MDAWRKCNPVAVLLAGLLLGLPAAHPVLLAEETEAAEPAADAPAADTPAHGADAVLAAPTVASPKSAQPIRTTPTAGSDVPAPAGPTAPAVKPSEPIVIVYKNFPYTGWYVGSDSDRFTFKLQGGAGGKDTLLTFTWSGASNAERKILYRQFGIDAVEDTPVYGSQVEAEKVTLKTGLIYYGFTTELINDSNKKMIQFTGAQIKRLMLDPAEIAKTEKIKVYESQVFSNQEIYTRHKYEGKGLQNGADHFKMANFCTKLYLPDEGLEHLEAAGELDERFKPEKDPAIAQLQTELKEMSHRKAGDELVRQIDLNFNSHEFGTAMSLCDRFMKIFPDHPKNTYVSGVRTLCDKGKTTTDSGNVVQEIYSAIEDLVREKIATKAVQGVIMPGKRVVGNKGEVWEGEVKEESDKEIVLIFKTTNGDTKTIRLHKNNVKEILAIDMNKNNSDKKYIGYQEARQWVDGDRFAKDLFERVAKKLKLTPTEVQKYWTERTSGEYVLDKDGNFIPPKDFTRLMTVDVGSGTFLLYKGSGQGGNGRTNRNNNQSLAQQNARQNDSGAWSRNGNQVNGGVGGTQQQTGPNPQDIKPLSDTEWWDAAAISSRVQAVMGMVAMKFLEPKSTTLYTCAVCNGNGYLTSSIDMTGKVAYKCCPNCNGNLQLVRLIAK